MKTKTKLRILDITTIISSAFLALCFTGYALGGTMLSDGGGLFVTIAALCFAILPHCLAFFIKKLRFFHALQIIYTSLLLIFALSFTVFSIFVMTEYDGNTRLLGEKVIIVCGCKTDGYTPGNKLKCRLDGAYSLLCENPDTIAILAGGMGEDEGGVSEAESMRKYLTDKGIDPSRLLIEDKSRNTVENIRNSIEIMKNNGIDTKQPIVCLSSDFHAVRVEIIAKQHGLDARAIGVAVENEPLYPSLVREFMSYIKYFVFGQP